MHHAKYNEYNAVVKSFPTLVEEIPLLTEKEVSRSWHALFKGGEYNEQTFEKAELLLEELRPESPLWHRLNSELEEIRKMATIK